MLSVHDALEAWKLGKITPKQAMKLAGACSVEELHELAVACDVNTGATESETSGFDNPTPHLS